jgi:hypothetical protein
MAEKQRSPLDVFGVFAELATQFEQAGNLAANASMKSAEFSRAMNEALAASVGAQRIGLEARRRVYELFDVASHSDIVAVQERLAAIDEKLHTIAEVLSRLDPMASAAPARPRTRKPPAESMAEPSPTPAPAPAEVRKRAARTRR